MSAPTAEQLSLFDLPEYIRSASAAEAPEPVESFGPADPEPVDQEPDLEEVEVDDEDAQTSLADPAVLEVQ